MRRRVARAARVENRGGSRDIDKQNVPDEFLRGRGDCDSALRRRFRDRGKRRAIPRRAARFVSVPLGIARANAPTRDEGSDQSRLC